MAMVLMKQLNFDVCEHINKLRVKEFNEEFEKKKQEDAQDLKETIQDFTEFLNGDDEDYERNDIFVVRCDQLDIGEAKRDLTYELYDLYIKFCDEICEGRKKIMYDMLYDNIDEFFQVVLNYGVEQYDLDKNDHLWVDINWDYAEDLSGLTQYINNIMTENDYVRYTSKIIWYNPHTCQDVYALDKRCKAYKRGKIDARNGIHTMDEDAELFIIVTNLWNRRDYDAINKIVKKWMKTKN